MNKKKIAVIGAGNMGGAIIKGIKNAKSHLPHHVKKKVYEIIASDIDKKKLKRLKVFTAKTNKEAIETADIIILAIKPQNIDKLLHEIKNITRSSQLIISIAAGITTKKIEKALIRNIPVVRVMPNTPALVGMGMSVLCPGKYAEARHLQTAKRIFSSMGKVEIVKREKLMDAVTAVSGSGPAYVYLFIESIINSALKMGLSKESAKKLVVQTIKGSIKLLEDTNKEPETLRRQVTSPGGTTEAALRVFKKKQFQKIINIGILSAEKKSRELTRISLQIT